jgi:HSP20 family protein
MSALTKWNPFQSTRWEPFRELEEIERRLENLFERSPFSPLASTGRTQEAVSTQQWHPHVDISEDDKEYMLKADLPEVAKNDVKVSFREGVLEIAGERKQEKKESGRRFHRTERSYGAFLRSFTLPAAAEGEKARAEFHDGVLTVRIPKSEKLAPKAIEVKVS